MAICPSARDHWVEIRLVDDEGRPIAGEPYVIYAPGGETIRGTLDDSGHARHDNLRAGSCKVVFPSRERSWWEAEAVASPPSPPTEQSIVTAALPAAPDSWIEIHLVDDGGQPVAFEPYEIRLGDQTVAAGRSDENGFARRDTLLEGAYQVVFPRRESSWWSPDSTDPPPPPEPARSAVRAFLPSLPAPELTRQSK